jgi:hypothetical protein
MQSPVANFHCFLQKAWPPRSSSHLTPSRYIRKRAAITGSIVGTMRN